MNIEFHRAAIRESLEIIKESIARGIEERQRTLGFHISVAAADMLEVMLHEKRLIDPGASIKHDFFVSRGVAESRLLSDFPMKSEIIGLMVELEAKRNMLIYGKPQKSEQLEAYIAVFNNLVEIFDKLGVGYE